jgi:NADPH-dependent 2,4-dienoyl-CoA reductase/sulfur reductase-like enzyme
MNRPKYLVVGAGPSGLGIAAELVTFADVTLIDRIPVTGGSAGWEHRGVRRLSDELEARGAELRLGQTALRWDGRELTVAGPGHYDRVTGSHLFFAGGLRPSTLADLGAFGDRPAGVLPATVAEHLLHAGVKLWDRVAVLGDGPWAQPVAALCRRLGTAVTHVGPADRYCILGRDRVHALLCHRGADTEEIICDAVVLAGDPQPNRNVDMQGSVDARAVTFHQPVAPVRFEERVAAARAIARQWINTSGAVV